MRNVETPPRIERDESTAYVTIDPAGIGATLDQLADAGDVVRHVVVCGPRPGHGKSGALDWYNRRGDWLPVAVPFVSRSALRATMGRDGREVRVTRIEPWLGEHVEPAAAAEAMRVIRHTTGRFAMRPFGTPAQTGRGMLRNIWRAADAEYPSPPADVCELLAETSGQGRFEVFPNDGGAELVAVDARFQYGALAQLELPAGAPGWLDGEPDEYAPSWCEVEFRPTDALGLPGILGVQGRRGWEWPTDPTRTFYGWCSGAELQLARRCGYRVTVRRAVVWPRKARPLATWARQIDADRERLERLPLDPDVKAAARAGLRAIVVQTIGSIHGRAGRAPALPSPSASADEEGSAGAFVHPEWSTAIWATARVRLARAMIEQTAPVVACALDGFYVAGEPVLPVDTGKAGAWREVWRGGSWPALRSMPDVYALRGVEQ